MMPFWRRITISVIAICGVGMAIADAYWLIQFQMI